MNRKIKVLCFGRFCDEVPGGTQSHVESLCGAMANAVDFVNLVPSRDRKTATFHIGKTPVFRMAGFSLGTSISFSWRMMFQARFLYKKNRFDIVHLHFPDPMSHLASWFVPWSVPRVISWHSDILRQRRLLFFYKPFLRRALNKANAIVVATPAHVSSSNFLHLIKDKSKLHIVPYGINTQRFTGNSHVEDASILSVKQKAQQRSIVFALGRHVYYKGFDVLIRAMKEAQDNCFLVLGGTGPLTDSFQQQVESLNLQNSIHFAGFIPNENLPNWFGICQIFCLPSVAQTEAFGIVQLEAMASGKPVISTALNNGVDYVNQHLETGLIVEPGNAGELASALIRLSNDPTLRQSMGSAGQQRVQLDFSESRMAELTLKVYKKVLGKATSAIPMKL